MTDQPDAGPLPTLSHKPASSMWCLSDERGMFARIQCSESVAMEIAVSMRIARAGAAASAERIAKLEAGLRRVLEVLELVEYSRPHDDLAALAVHEIAESLGYGRLMVALSRMWRDKVTPTGLAGSEFVAGPCQITIDGLISDVRALLAPPEVSR